MDANNNDLRRAPSTASTQGNPLKGAVEHADALLDEALGAISGGGVSEIVITKRVDPPSPN